MSGELLNTRRTQAVTEWGKMYPRDEFNRELEHNVHPEEWRNPYNKIQYNLGASISTKGNLNARQ